MPKINIDNYDTVASWNGSQDLFVVEQPDGTKVATPAMVKQFIEAGDFEATGEVKDGHGNKLAGKQDTLTFDNAPTEDSDNPVKSGGIFSALADKQDASGLAPVSFTVTPSSNITNLQTNDQNCYYIPATGEVHIQFLFYTPDANIPVMGNIIATVPSAYKPSEKVQFVATLGNSPIYNANIERGFVNPSNGGIALNNFVYGNRATSWIYVDVSYIK